MLDSSSRTRVRGLVLAAICAAALGLAACGDDDDDSGDGATTDVATTSTTETDTTESETTETDETESPESESDDEPASASDFSDVVRAQLEQAGAPASQIDCVVEELESTLDDEALVEAAEQLEGGGEFPQEIIDAAAAAGQKCLTTQ